MCTAIAVSVLASGAVALSATNAAAKVPPEDPPGPVTPTSISVPVDDALAEGLQAGASALGGAGVAVGGLWLYRRRRLLAS